MGARTRVRTPRVLPRSLALTSAARPARLGVHFGEQDGQTSLMYASSNGYADAMEVLIKAGANLDARDKFGFTALMVAATTGEAEAIRILIASGAKPDATDNFGNTVRLPLEPNPPP